MKHLKYLSWGILLACGLSFSSCAHQHKKELLPSHDEVLRYPLAYDLVFLRTIEGLENIQGWEVQETEKEKGIIRVYNHQIGRTDDSDNRVATIFVKRVNRNETTVELASGSRRVGGGKEMMQVISQYVSREL